MSVSEPSDPLAVLRAAVSEVAHDLDRDATATPTLERPPKAELGDYSTNAAMLLAPRLGSPPRAVAERLIAGLAQRLGDAAARIEVAGPGFVNVFLSDRWYREATAELAGRGELGTGAGEDAEPTLVEFVSANPTGPVTVAGGRAAAYGDSVARLLAHRGHRVEREYYLNDGGSQVRLFAQSVAARIRGEQPPEGGYGGDYVAELAAKLADAGARPDDLDSLRALAVETMRGRIEATLARFGVDYDTWFSERSLYAEGAIELAIELLRERGHVYESEGAVWLRTTEFGDDKDRVLIRADGDATYFAPDIAYHLNKVERGWQRLVTPLGADHHGYVPRMKAALAAAGIDPDRYEAPIIQLVSVVEAGERSRMSKRKGDFVALDELVEDIGVDAARFFMVQRSHDTTIDIDLDLARSQSQDNPVYYVQYAHARIASIMRKAEAERSLGSPEAVAEAAAAEDALAAPCEPAERALVRRLLELRGELETAAARRAPHRLCAFGIATAADFHAFYRDCRVVGAEPATEAARLGLCLATARTIATTLGLIGVSAPDQM